MLKNALITFIGIILFSINCKCQVIQIGSKIFEAHENILFGPSNVENYYPNQSAKYIEKYSIQKNRLIKYILEVEQKINQLESKKIKNKSRIKNYKLEITKSELELQLIDELIELWEYHKMVSKKFYSNFPSDESHSLDCFDFIVEGDTVNGEDLIISKIEHNSKESYYEIINDKIIRIIGDISEEDKVRFNEFNKNPKSFKSYKFQIEIVDYIIKDFELNDYIEGARHSTKYENRELKKIILELDDPKFIEKIEKRFPTYSFDSELLELYKEVKYIPLKGYLRMELRETGEQIIPEEWIKIPCN